MAAKNIASVKRRQPQQVISVEPYRRRKGTAWVWILVVLFVVGLGIAAGGVAGYIWFEGPANRVMPGVSVDGLPLGGLTPKAAVQKLDQAWNTRAITMTDGTHAWQTGPAFFGLWMDPGATLQQAVVIASPEISWENLQTRWNPPTFDLHPVVRFDLAVAQSQLTRWALQVDRPAQDAALRLENGQPIVTPSQPGTALDIAATLEGIALDPQGTMTSQQVRLVFKPVQPAVIDVSPAEAQVNALLGQKIGGGIYDPITDEKIPWQIPQDQVASWVRLSQDASGYHAEIARDKLVAYLAELDKHVDLGPERVIDPPADPNSLADQALAGQTPVLIARYLPTEYTVQSNTTLLQVGWKVGIQLWRLQKANPGVNPNALAPGQKLVIPSKSDLLPLPVVMNKRIVISITQQRMWVYEDGAQIREFVISTGIANSPTQPGVYQVQTHDLNAYAANWDLYMPHWMGIYEAWPGFMNGIHGLPMLSSGVRLWANVLGKPASYGCIILNLPNAEWLYNWAESGVVVEIQA